MSKFKLSTLSFALISLCSCAMGQLDRVDNAPVLTRDAVVSYNAASTSTPAAPSRNRHDINTLYEIDYGRVLDSSVVSLEGTTQTGAQTGAAVGAINNWNRGTTSMDSMILRILGGAVVGAVIESSLTQGQATEYIIERRNGSLAAVITQYRLEIGTCVMMRIDPTSNRTDLEVRPAEVCERIAR